MAEIGALTVKIGADTGGLSQGLSRARGSLNDFSRQAGAAITRVAALGAAATAAGTALVAGLVVSGNRAIDAQAKLARSMDGTYDGLRAVQIAASDAGVSQEAAGTAAQMLGQRLAEAARGAGAAYDAIDRLGLSAVELQRMDTDQRMAAIADRMRELGYSAGQAADTLRDMGIRNREMALMLFEGGDALRAARQEVDDFGLSVSAVDAAKIEAANDAMSRIGRVIEGIRNQLSIAFAPLLQEVADRFNDVARANQGWSTQAQRAAELIVKGFARVLDMYRYLQIAAKSAEIGAASLGVAYRQTTQQAAEAIGSLVDSTIEGVNRAIEALNMLPKVDIAKIDTFGNSAFMQGMRRETTNALLNISRVRQEMADLTDQEMPSAKAEAFFQEVQDRAQKAAEATVAAREALGGGFDDDGAQAETEEVDNSAIQRRVEKLREFLATEQELEEMRHLSRLETLQEALDAELLTKEEYNEMEAELVEAHQERLNEIEQRAAEARMRTAEQERRARISVFSGMFQNLTTLTNTGSRKLFEIGKAAAYSNALIKGHEAVTSSYAAGARVGGPVVGAAFAATAAVATAAQIAQIRNTTFGGSGTPSVVGSGGTPVVPTEQQGGPAAGHGQATQISLVGETFGREQVRGLIEQINDSIGDGSILVVT